MPRGLGQGMPFLGRDLFPRHDPLFHKVTANRMIFRDLLDDIPQKIRTAVAHMADGGLLVPDCQDNQGGPHSHQVDVGLCLFYIGVMGLEKGL